MRIEILFLLCFGATTALRFHSSTSHVRCKFKTSIKQFLMSEGKLVILNHMSSSDDSNVQDSLDSDAALMAKIRAAQEDNVSTRWTLEDDQILYNGVKENIPLETLCVTLKRGYQGVKARINHLNNPKHKAHMRYFGIEEVEGDKALGSIYLRPCRDCIERIVWDPALDIKDFSFIYQDRFDGLYEKPCVAPNDNVKGKERMLIKAIPEHRIQSIKYKERVVWDKEDRMDLIFGSSIGLIAMQQAADGTIRGEAGLIGVMESEGNDTWSQPVEDQGLDATSDYEGVDATSDTINIDTSSVSEGTDTAWYDDETLWDDDDENISNNTGNGKNLKIEDVIATYYNWLLSKREKETIEETKSFVIFCDLDGVLVDFEAGVQKIFKKKKTAEISPKVLWPRLATTPNFYAQLPWMEGGNHLWDSIKQHNPTIITGCPRGDWAPTQKRTWTARELGADVAVITCMSKDKFKYCTPGAILIDDREATKDSWEGAGGVFLLHESVRGTLQMLRDMGVKIPIAPQTDFME